MTGHEKKVFNEAIDTFGAANQLIVLFEEMSELQKAICKSIRYSKTWFLPQIEEEMADVIIMLDQAKMILGVDDENLEMWRMDKIVRLQERIDKRRAKRGKKTD